MKPSTWLALAFVAYLLLAPGEWLPGEWWASERAKLLGLDNTPPPAARANLTRLRAALDRFWDPDGYRLTSAFRSDPLNAVTPVAADHSLHKLGLAADFEPLKMSIDDAHALALSFKGPNDGNANNVFREVIRYRSHLHVAIHEVRS